jgi:hypothetical protein
MAKKTKKMAFGGSAGPMESRPTQQGFGSSKAGSGQNVNQGRARDVRGEDRVSGGGRGRDGRDDRPSMVRPGFPSGPRPGATQPPIQPPTGTLAPVGGPTKTMTSGPQPMNSPAMIRFSSPEASADYIKRYNESMAATGGKQYNPGYAKGGAVKPKKMASGGMAKSSSGGRGWGKARGSKSAKVC